ncbi:fibronectin type III domain-containing protein [Candidatus Woesearchaeota archaeon]|nr:fibronectin type III domain-containing protein [Candidatus Woesearchaeota archaeon]
MGKSFAYSKSILLLFLLVSLFISIFSLASSAALLRGNVTLLDKDINSSHMLNLSANGTLSGLGGHIQIDNRSSSNLLVFIGVNNTKVFRHNYWDRSFELYTSVPNSTFNNLFGEAYYLEEPMVNPKDIVPVLVNESGTLFYGAIYVVASVPGYNASLEYVFNTVAGNTTFTGSTDSCTNHKDFDTCLNDSVYDCTWYDDRGICEVFNGVATGAPALCGIMPKVACNGLNQTFCAWNTSHGKSGLCVQQANFVPATGFNCTVITNQTVCANQSFTVSTGLCSWNGSCNINLTKTFDNLPDPPTFSCQAAGYVSNQANCEDLANTYFMPCGWNNVSSRCEELFIDFGSFQSFEDVSSEKTCQAMGGSWRTETTYNPLSNVLSSESWCEFGSAIKTFEQVGKTQNFSQLGGSSSQLNDCTRDCFACEFKSTGARWENATEATSQCTNSTAGCTFRPDTNAFNAQGWCEPKFGLVDHNCDVFCGDCNLQPDPLNACTNSTLGCKWDNRTGFCVDSSTKGCDQDCIQCNNQTTCERSSASAGCTWDTGASFCKPKGGAYELCFDLVDNDGNGKTDCADTKCSGDSFCGAAEGVGATCYKYDSFFSGGNAEANCTGTTGCTWYNNSYGFSSCIPTREICYQNRSLTTAAACNGHAGGGVCKFITENECLNNVTFMERCFGRSEAACGTTSGCKWDSGSSFCDFAPLATCDKNTSLQNDQTACRAAGCAWVKDGFSHFEGSFGLNCVSPCNNNSLTTSASCTAANGTAFAAGICEWIAGYCQPDDFIGGCEKEDGDIADCNLNSNCQWSQVKYGPIANFNSSTNFDNYKYTNETWLAVGLQYPLETRNNESNYYVNKSATTFIRLYSASAKVNATRIYCNTSIIMEYNWSTQNCTVGTCNTYATSTCEQKNVHYSFSNVTGEIEALWELDIGSIVNLDNREVNENVTTTGNRSTVTINGNLSEHISENATSNDSRNASRVRTASGFCNDAMIDSFFTHMEDNEGTLIGADTTRSTGDPADQELDISDVSVKKTPESYMYAIGVANMTNSIICKGAPLSIGGSGNQSNISKYYLYLDTNGKATGGCAAQDNSSLVGFEYIFKYVGGLDTTNNKVSDSLSTLTCADNGTSDAWVASNVPFKVDKIKTCSLTNGPIFAIDKDVLTGKPNCNTSISWRVYAATANSSGNATSVADTIPSSKADFTAVDAEMFDCMDPLHKDDTQCSKFKQFGFFPGEFGPACKDAIDNDGDSLTDCDDSDCFYDPFFCSGTGLFEARADDSSSPTVVWTKTNNKVPTSLSLIFDTNEPANGSVKFYNTDANCSTLNRTVLDNALLDGTSFTNFRPHHVADITSLAANTTYYYKINSCDPSGNCVTSKCTNATTAATHTNITFLIAVPANWSVNIPALNLSNYTKGYALKASTALLNNVNITINSPENDTGLTLTGLDIFEKQTLNISQFIDADGLVGIDANQYQAFKQKTGLENTIIRIDTAKTSGAIEHCDESGSGCKDVTSKMESCAFNADETICTMPDAVGLGFSSYKSQGGGGGSSSGGSSRASAGGGGSSAQPSTPPSNPPAYASSPAKESTELTEVQDAGETATEQQKKEAAPEALGKAVEQVAVKEGETWKLKGKWALGTVMVGILAMAGLVAYARRRSSFDVKGRR